MRKIDRTHAGHPAQQNSIEKSKMISSLSPRRLTSHVRRGKQTGGSRHLWLALTRALFILTIDLTLPQISRAQIVSDASTPVVDTIPITAPTGGGLGGIVTSPNGKTVYVAVTANSTVALINTSKNQLSSFIAAAANPVGVAISPDGNTLYATDVSNQLEVLSVGARQLLYTVPVGKAPQIPGVSPDGTIILVPSLQDGQVTPIDYYGTPAASINVGGKPVHVVFNRAGTEAYVSNEKNNTISVIKTSSNAVSTIATPGPTVGLALNGTTLYATGLGAVYVINLKTGTVTSTIQVPNPANAFLAIPSLTPAGDFLYVPVLEFGSSPSNPGQTLLVINTKTKKIEGQPIQVGLIPIQMAIGAGGSFGYLSTEFSGFVSVIKLLK